jgi:hypothetical protein
MDVRSVGTKALSTLGMIAIGDGLATAVAPRRHLRAWSFGDAPRWYEKESRAVATNRWRSLVWAAGTLAVGAALVYLAERKR